MALLALFSATTRPACDEFHLVFQSVGIDSEVVDYEDKYYLLVDESVAEYAYTQLKVYVEENAPEQHITRPLRPFKQGFVAAYIYAIILVLVNILQNNHAFGLDWTQLGLADSYKLVAGEWWLNFTALSLHADIAHLAGNIGFGVLFGLLVSQYIGAGAAWLTILLSGATGNALNAWLYNSLHLSMGASTMVFAALGILGVFSLNARYAYHQRGIRRWLPFFAAIALLGFTGTAGERTDVLAHISGFASGCVAATLWLTLGKDRVITRQHQIFFGVISVFILIFTWTLAIENV